MAIQAGLEKVWVLIIDGVPLVFRECEGAHQHNGKQDEPVEVQETYIFEGVDNVNKDL